MPLTMPSMAASSGASSKTMLAALPPSSSVSRLPVPASERWMSLPTSVEPVNATFFTPGCDTTSEPVLPPPVRMLTTPGGSSACVIEEVRRSERDVDVPRLLDRLAAVHRLDHGQLAGALLDDARDPEEV